MTQLDVEWRRRLEFAALHYAAAKKAVIRAAEIAKTVPVGDASFDIQESIAAERAALREYTQTLAIFTQIVLDGSPPGDGQQDAWSCHVQSHSTYH